MFPGFNENVGLKNSMKEGTRLFLERVVLAPGADVRSYFDSNQTFADAALAPIYGVTPPNSGFAQFTLAPTSGRVGIMGQAAMLAGHDPLPAVVMDRRWDLLRVNGGAARLFGLLFAPEPVPEAANVLRVMVDVFIHTRLEESMLEQSLAQRLGLTDEEVTRQMAELLLRGILKR